jgi:hypothetical protein
MYVEQIFDWQKSHFRENSLGFFLFGFLVNPTRSINVDWHKVFLEHVLMLLERFQVLLEQFLVDFCLAKISRFRENSWNFSLWISG